MQNLKQSKGKITGFIFALVISLSSSYSQEVPNVPSQYRKYFVKYVDKRSMMERMLNVAGLSNQDIGRSFALIAGISYYPNMAYGNQKLEAAGEDLRKLEDYLKKYEFFDEIVVLKNEHVKIENFEFFLQNYFASRIRDFPNSRFLLAYSGHGMTMDGTGYLLKNTARNLEDKNNSINLNVLRVYMNDVVKNGHHVLVLLNSCYSGAFTNRIAFGGPNHGGIPRNPGAHAITAGGSNEIAWADKSLGSGSIFFEKIFAGLDGRADTGNDGIVTVYELSNYLRREVQIFTNQSQNPQVGDLSLNGSKGEFFFLNRDRQVSKGILPSWNPESKGSFGSAASAIDFDKAVQFYRSKDYSSAASGFKQAAAKGNIEAMAYLGYMYETGLGLPVDFKESFYWTEKAAQGGNAWGMGGLGVMYRDGEWVNKDYAKALLWFRKAADAGNARSMNNLGWMYEKGYGAKVDYETSFYWYEKGAQAGDALAMYNVGRSYEKGLGVNQDYTKASSRYREGAEAGNADAMLHLGLLFHNGEGVTRDYSQAVIWYREGAEAGNASCMGNLGLMYRDGLGVPKDYTKSVLWFRKGAEAGNAYSMNKLGYMYESGFGVTKDYQQAGQWYRKAMDGGDKDGTRNLGYLYERGFGVAKNHTEAIRLYQEAAKLGDDWAKKRLKELGEEPNSTPTLRRLTRDGVE